MRTSSKAAAKRRVQYGALPYRVSRGDRAEFMLVTSTFAREPLLAVILVAGLLIAFAALLLRLQQILFGEPIGPAGEIRASYVPLFVHVAFVSIAGLWLPEAIVHWFRAVAAQLG